MKHGEFEVGATFWCGGREWRCTDIGRRTIVAIRIDSVDVGSNAPDLRRTLSRREAEAEGWFNGPPYAVAAVVFDEDAIMECVPPHLGRGVMTEHGDIFGEENRRKAAAKAARLREQAEAGGLRFEAYLPPALALWLLDQVERGVFIDPSEAVFVMLGEQRELEPHADLREELLRRSCQQAIDDPRPAIPHDEVVERIEKQLAEPRPQPAVWRRDPA